MGDKVQVGLSAPVQGVHLGKEVPVILTMPILELHRELH
jgi:hypothetical protein